MKIIVMLTIGLFLLTSCDDSPRKTKSSNNIDKWYVGGNLHKSKIIDWKNTTEKIN